MIKTAVTVSCSDLQTSELTVLYKITKKRSFLSSFSALFLAQFVCGCAGPGADGRSGGSPFLWEPLVDLHLMVAHHFSCFCVENLQKTAFKTNIT